MIPIGEIAEGMPKPVNHKMSAKELIGVIEWCEGCRKANVGPRTIVNLSLIEREARDALNSVRLEEASEMMYPRIEYEMTEDDLSQLLDACKSVPMMIIGGVVPSSPQENANNAWERLGKKMGFQGETVQPISGKGQRFFSAIPSETPEARQEREHRECEEKRQQEIGEITAEIASLQDRLSKLAPAQPAEE